MVASYILLQTQPSRGDFLGIAIVLGLASIILLSFGFFIFALFVNLRQRKASKHEDT
jgi:uncharacterized membrane-anchored protein